MISLNYDLGLRRLWAALDALEDEKDRVEKLARFATLEARLHQNRSDEQLFGSSDSMRTQLAQVNHSLNQLTLDVLDWSFTDLCRMPEGDPPAPRAVVSPVERAPAEEAPEVPRVAVEDPERCVPEDQPPEPLPASLTMDLLVEEGYLHALAELFNRELEIRSVLADARIPITRLMPVGNHVPLQYWRYVLTQLDAGIVENGFETLLRAAAGHYPFHRLLRQWAS